MTSADPHIYSLIFTLELSFNFQDAKIFIKSYGVQAKTARCHARHRIYFFLIVKNQIIWASIFIHLTVNLAAMEPNERKSAK